jgi:hypothetical protein
MNHRYREPKRLPKHSKFVPEKVAGSARFRGPLAARIVTERHN